MCAVMYVCSPEYPAFATQRGELEADGERRKRVRHYIPMALILVVVGITWP